MQISDEGLRLIKSFEGYGRKMPNGDCCAYQTKLKGGLDIPTIGWGCTEGIHMGIVWTVDQATAALKHEIAKHELAVSQLVKVEINQNEFDACVSLSYNIGTGIGAKGRGFANSSILAKLNAGDRAGAAKAFLSYNRAKGKVEPGLTSRRTRESALFQKPAVQPEEPYMAQTVDPPLTIHPAVKTGATVTTTSGGIYIFWHQILAAMGMGDPSVPDGWEDQAFGFLDTAQKHTPVIKSLIADGIIGYALAGVGLYFLLGHILPVWLGNRG